MGERSQIAIKVNGGAVYLYAHNGGTTVFSTLQRCIKAGARLNDPEYFARIVFREMGAGSNGETGYGIGLVQAADLQHIVPIVDCESQTISFSVWLRRIKTLPPIMTFQQFAALDESVFASW